MPTTVSFQRKTILRSCHFHLLSVWLKLCSLQQYNLLVKFTYQGKFEKKTIAKCFPHHQVLLEPISLWPVRKKDAIYLKLTRTIDQLPTAPLPRLRLTPLDRTRLSVLFPSQPECISAFTVNHSVGSSSVHMSDTLASRGLSFHLCLAIKTQWKKISSNWREGGEYHGKVQGWYQMEPS